MYFHFFNLAKVLSCKLSFSVLQKEKDLYIPKTTIDEEEVYSSEDKDNSNRLQAQRDLGSDFTEEQFNEWKQNKDKNAAEDRLAYEERDILEDDDETLE